MNACDACGAEGCQFHHLTGRDDQGRYLDPESSLPLCKDHHPLAHDHWKTLDLEVATRRLTTFERIEIGMRRCAATLMVLDGGTGTTVFGVLAALLVKWANQLAAGTRRLDERDPTWREDRGFYPA